MYPERDAQGGFSGTGFPGGADRIGIRIAPSVPLSGPEALPVTGRFPATGGGRMLNQVAPEWLS